jgi:ABC-type Fe3+/spermidine/putrescine transport system ATPase subunit
VSDGETPAPDVRLVEVVKRFDDVIAVDGISLEIPRGSFFALLGPSGCGKTTTLRMIGGFERPTSGRIYLGDTEVEGLPPYKRDVNTVFQSYALFPHLTIYDNVAFGLRRKGAASRRSSPVGSSNGLRSRARSSTARASSCSTSHSVPSTSSCASRCSSS